MIKKPVPGQKVTAREMQYTVVLHPEQSDFLDELSLRIRKRSRAKLDRSKLIRGIVTGVALSKLALDSATSEQEVAELVRSTLSK